MYRSPQKCIVTVERGKEQKTILSRCVESVHGHKVQIEEYEVLNKAFQWSTPGHSHCSLMISRTACTKFPQLQKGASSSGDVPVSQSQFSSESGATPKKCRSEVLLGRAGSSE